MRIISAILLFLILDYQLTSILSQTFAWAIFGLSFQK